MKPPVIISDYDPRLPILYEEEKVKILSVVERKVVAIEHIGSTAVPGLGAKPIIDIMIAIRHLADVESCVQPLQCINYEYMGEYGIPGRYLFRKPPGSLLSVTRTHNLHMVEQGSDFWERHLLFRDFLRVHPEVAKQYYELKKELATKYGSDRDAYSEAKTSFIESVIDKVRAVKATSL